MSEDFVNIKYSHDGEYRCKIESSENGLFHIWIEEKIYDYSNDDFAGMEFVGWRRAGNDNQIHLADNYEHANEIGNEILRNLTGSL